MHAYIMFTFCKFNGMSLMSLAGGMSSAKLARKSMTMLKLWSDST